MWTLLHKLKIVTCLMLATFLWYVLVGIKVPDKPPNYVLNSDFKFPDVPQNVNEHGIPLVVHQMWKDRNIPQKWQTTRKDCMKLNHEYTHILWTDEMLYNFIWNKYSWFYTVFIRYRYNIQRVDVTRYFLLYHYGGVYLDLDLICKSSLRSIFKGMNATQTTFLAAAKVDGVTNSFMASVPRSEFFKHVIYELPVNVHGKFELFRHTTIIFSTGPQFVSHCWRTFKNRNEIVVMTLDKFDGVHFKNQLMNEWHSFDTNVVQCW